MSEAAAPQRRNQEATSPAHTAEGSDKLRPRPVERGVVARAVRVLALVLLTVISVAVAVSGAFMHRWASPAGLVLAVGAAAGVCVLARHTARSRVGIAVVGVVWLAAVLVLAQPRPAGDVIVAGDPAGLVFLFGGALGVAVTVGMGAPRTGTTRLVASGNQIKIT